MRNAFIAAALAISFLTVTIAVADVATNPAAGLWVGEVVLQNVNEAVSGVNAANQIVSPDPNVTTPTYTPARLRIILHVDASGQVRLLKGVAMVATNLGATTLAPTNLITASGLILLSNPSLYAQYGNLPGQRLTAVGYDFGDGPAAQNALQSVAAAAGTAAANNFGALPAMNTAALAATATALRGFQTNIPAGATAGYSNFVQSSTFSGIVSNVAYSAASSLNGVAASVPASRKIEIATLAALQNLTDAGVLSAADALSLNELPLTNWPGAGAVTDFRGVQLKGTIYLGADHPTNPFRHRWNPGERHGYAITRNVTITFDSTNSQGIFGFGVDHITGNYAESIFGLHKALGPNQDIGLKTDGTIKLDRISPIAVLNQ
jgi:hypothetical protein